MVHGRLWVKTRFFIKVASLSVLMWSLFSSSFFTDHFVSANNANLIKGDHYTYLPLIFQGTQNNENQVFVGVYTDGYLGEQATIDQEVKAIDTWSGKKNSIVGTFIAIEDRYPDYNIPVPLGRIWDSGYTPFVNLETQRTLADINAGKLDNEIKSMAGAFKAWRDQGLEKNQDRRALVAPLQEMNGYWVNYHGSPDAFKAAFKRIQDLFSQEGATSAVRWVFAPNGWSDPSDPPFEEYYPGDSAVEAVAFSGYNSGYCASAEWKTWSGPEEVYGSYIQRMRIMTPSKPIIVAQTGTTAYTAGGFSEQAKNEWLSDAYAYLANSPGVFAIIYFNKDINQSCDWPFYEPGGVKFTGYREGVNLSQFGYISPEDLAKQTLTP